MMITAFILLIVGVFAFILGGVATVKHPAGLLVILVAIGLVTTSGSLFYEEVHKVGASGGLLAETGRLEAGKVYTLIACGEAMESSLIIAQIGDEPPRAYRTEGKCPPEQFVPALTKEGLRLIPY